MLGDGGNELICFEDFKILLVLAMAHPCTVAGRTGGLYILHWRVDMAFTRSGIAPESAVTTIIGQTPTVFVPDDRAAPLTDSAP